MKNVFKKIAGALIVIGFVLLLGTVGMSDTDAICFEVAFLRAVGCVALIASGMFGVLIIEKKEN